MTPDTGKPQELRPCPFCGSTDVGGAAGIITCYGCKAESGHYFTTDDAAVAWNRRAATVEQATRAGGPDEDGQCYFGTNDQCPQLEPPASPAEPGVGVYFDEPTNGVSTQPGDGLMAEVRYWLTQVSDRAEMPDDLLARFDAYLASQPLAAAPKHLARRGMMADGTFPSADDDENDGQPLAAERGKLVEGLRRLEEPKNERGDPHTYVELGEWLDENMHAVMAALGGTK